jgi:simple sugar transport system permease protein
MKQFLSRNRRSLSALVFFIVLILIFMVAAPTVFLNPTIYNAVFVSLPLSAMLAAALVFIIASGEIDLSFPSVIGLAAWGFALCVQNGLGPWIGLVVAIVAAVLAGFVNGFLVNRLGLSSLVSTLGIAFLLRGLINIGTQGNGIPMTVLQDTPFYNLFVGSLGGFPAQMVWGLGFCIVSILLFNLHQFGAQVCCVGDNRESAREMGINVGRVRTYAFVYVAVAAALVGVFSVLINLTFWPTTGDGYLLPTLAAVFVGGNPTYGGSGTVLGAVIGAFIIGFIQTGIIAAGLTGFFTQFFYGLIMILALIGHRFNDSRYRS